MDAMTNQQPRHGRSAWRAWLDSATSVALLAAAGAVLWLSFSVTIRDSVPPPRTRPAVPVAPVSVAEATSLGSRRAPFALVVFSDFECPYCGMFARDVLPVLRDGPVASGRLLIAFKHMPLPNHGLAIGAAHAAECAGREGKFWQLHDEMFRIGAGLDRQSVLTAARGIGLDMDAFESCLSDEPPGVIRSDASQASALGLRSTPSFFFGSRNPDGTVTVSDTLSGARPLADFLAMLQPALDAGQ